MSFFDALFNIVFRMIIPVHYIVWPFSIHKVAFFLISIFDETTKILYFAINMLAHFLIAYHTFFDTFLL